jgi:hypothetical protein
MHQAAPPARQPTVLEMSGTALELRDRLFRDRERRHSFNSLPAVMHEQHPNGPGVADRSAPRPQDRPVIPGINFAQERNINQLISQYTDSEPAFNDNTGQAQANAVPEMFRPRSTPPGNSVALFVPDSSGQGIASNPLNGPSQLNDSLLNGGVNDNTGLLQFQSGQSQGIPVGPRMSIESRPRQPLVPASQLYRLPQTPKQSPLLQSRLAFRPSPRPSGPPGPLTPPVATMNEKSNPVPDLAAGQGINNGPRTPFDNPNAPREAQGKSSDSNMTDAARREAIGNAIPPNSAPALASSSPLPNLAQLLEHDRDLYDWLTITNYFNLEHRAKVLERRREIMELDEQRSKLLAEIQADEHPVLLAPRNPTGTLPPPPPSPVKNIKQEFIEAEALSNAASTQQAPGPQASSQQASVQQAPAPQAPKSLASAPPLTAPREPRNFRGPERERQNDRVVSNKRAHSARGSHDEQDTRNKVQRTNSARPRTPIRSHPRSRSRARSRSPRYRRRTPSPYEFERRRYRYPSPLRARGRSPPRPRSPLHLRSPPGRGWDYRDDREPGYDYEERPRFGPPRRPRTPSPSMFSGRGRDRGRGRGRPPPPSPPRSYYHPRQHNANNRPRGGGRGRGRTRPEPSNEPPCPRATATDANGLIPFESGGLVSLTPPRDLGSRITHASDARKNGQ